VRVCGGWGLSERGSVQNFEVVIWFLRIPVLIRANDCLSRIFLKSDTGVYIHLSLSHKHKMRFII
jgi:hypothetical protein